MSKCMQRVSTEKIFDEKNPKSIYLNLIHTPVLSFVTLNFQVLDFHKIIDEKNSKSFAFNPHSNLVTLNF